MGIETADGAVRFRSKVAYKNYKIASGECFKSDSGLVNLAIARLIRDTTEFRRKRHERSLLSRGNALCYKSQWLKDNAIGFDGDECLFFPSMVAHRPEQVKYNYKQMAASRAVAMMSYGLPPKSGMMAIHKCGNGHLSCVNPSHIAWGTARDNLLDGRIHGGDSAANIPQAQIEEVASSAGLCSVLAWETGIPAAMIDAARIK